MDEVGLFVSLLLLAGMTFPLAFWIARICLAGVLLIIESEGWRRKGEEPRHADHVQPCRTP